MKIEVKHAELTDRIRLRNLMQFYLYDFSEFLPMELDANGCFKEEILDDYFANPDKAAFLVLVDGRIAGFALVSPEIVLEENQGGRCIKEFFIVRKYRRQAVGKTAASKILSTWPDKWEVRVERTNQPAVMFWESTIKEYAEGRYKKEERDDEHWRGIIFTIAVKPTAV